MTRARILADYVSSGDELALKAPITNAALVTPNLGTPSAGVMTNVTGMPLAGLSATGTASATSYLRGDNSWQTAGSTSASDLDSGTLAIARMVAGTVVKHSVKAIKDSVNIISSGTDWFDSGIEHIHTTALSSTDSYLRFDWYSGMTVKTVGTAVAQVDITMTTASDTTYDVSDSPIESDPSHYTTYIAGGKNDNWYHSDSATYYIGVPSGMGVAPNKTTWSAAEALYFRLWVKCSSGSYRINHDSSVFSMSVTEIKR